MDALTVESESRTKTDRGADGQAMTNRRRAYDASVGSDRFWDNHPLDILQDRQILTTRQTRAGRELCRLYEGGHARQRVTMRQGARGQDIFTREEETEQEECEIAYRKLVRNVPANCYTPLCHLSLGVPPRSPSELDRLREGLDRVADILKLPV